VLETHVEPERSQIPSKGGAMTPAGLVRLCENAFLAAVIGSLLLLLLQAAGVEHRAASPDSFLLEQPVEILSDSGESHRLQGCAVSRRLRWTR
jgi:hypothetical protein